MTFDPIAADLAVRAARAQAGSARPDAPVLPDPTPRAPRAAATRTRLAARLHGLARWVEPTPRRTCQPG
ncbi:hypothetical protein [Nocardioides sp. YIM 152315]|uniref:hypothetical protein n=1 Tax=Nocardioides sp. YIM 152315 TaxID=3031760 RepID=UPI0023D9F84A|nr:hypothetical protein [Nocardioides sp. YIM 152315]MDF1604650.1 hypothetical protein [Nocardioides sp. YIM 152315]